MARIWNKYPYTDFHELNADYVFEWIKKAQDFIEAFTDQVNQNTADIVSLKTRMTIAEGDISGLKTRMTTAEGKIATIENTLITDGAALDALKDIGGFVGGTLRGGRRKAANVTGRDLVTLDLDAIKKGVEPNEAYAKNIGTYGRFKAEDGAVAWIDPRKE